jgi:pyruvate,water dikinase
MIGFRLGEGPHDLALGSKACYLDRLKRAGLDVPEGQAYLLSQGDPEICQSVADDVRRFLPADLYAVRSSFPGEDSSTQSQAGQYRSHLRVSQQQLGWAIGDVFASGSSAQAPRAVLVQAMVDAREAGVMFCQPNFLDPLVSFTRGTAERLVGGQEAGEREELGPNSVGRRAAWRRLADQVVEVLGPGDLGWDLEWADDGDTVWLVQARPITGSPWRDELFSYANIREIMPDPPSVFMASVVESAGAELYDYYRRFDPCLPAGRPLIEVMLGRPLFNISLLTETMRHWGLPTRLVTDQIGGADIAEVGLSPRRLLSKTPVLLRQALSQFRAIGTGRAATRALLRWQPANNLADLADQTRALFLHLVTVMLDLTAALAVPLTLLRRLGTLEEHSRRHQTPTGRLLTELQPLRNLVAQHPEWHATLLAGGLPGDQQFMPLWRAYLQEFGHRGFFESDLAEPRFAEEPSAILKSLLLPTQPPAPTKLSLAGWLSWPLWLYTRQLLDVREGWRDAAMKAYCGLRAQALAQSSQLGQPNRVFDCTMKEWHDLAHGWAPTDEFWQQREADKAESRRYHFPDLLRRFHPRALLLSPELQNQGDRVDGMCLCGGTVEGIVWLARDAREAPPADLEEQLTVLVTRTVDPGWLFSLPRVAGVVVELGGDLSHGSILLRELGIPAITNATGATSTFAQGDRIRLVAKEGYAQKQPPEGP